MCIVQGPKRHTLEAASPDDTLTTLKQALADRYDVERELGRGGMATVYVAQDRKHGRPVAIKVLRPELAEMLGADRFLREIEIAANLVHPHILPLHDSGEAAGLLIWAPTACPRRTRSFSTTWRVSSRAPGGR